MLLLKPWSNCLYFTDLELGKTSLIKGLDNVTVTET